jgi:lipoyl synthase
MIMGDLCTRHCRFCSVKSGNKPALLDEQSLRALNKIKEYNSRIYTEYSLMVGLGKTEEEVTQTVLDLRAAGVDVLTIGQYLQWFKETTEPMGFKYVAASPLVRSSHKAGDFFLEKVIQLT